MAVFPMGSVMKLTDLTARQIRYYEEQELIFPERSEGNRRQYSLNDIDVLLEIKDYLSEGLNMAGVKRVIQLKQEEEQKKQKRTNAVTEEEVRRIFQDELMGQGNLLKPDPRSIFGNFRN
jgi:MerR family glutamine synthetase transcriptional repressor